MDNLNGGLAVFVVITMVIGFFFGDAAANGFVSLVIGFFEGVFNVFISIINALI